jgi:hypothetical protein
VALRGGRTRPHVCPGGARTPERLYRTPDAARLYSSPSTRANDLAILAMRLASDRSDGSSPRSIQAMYLSRQSPSLGGRLYVHGIGLVGAVPFEQG